MTLFYDIKFSQLTFEAPLLVTLGGIPLHKSEFPSPGDLKGIGINYMGHK